MKFANRLPAALLVAFMIIAVAACGGDEAGTADGDDAGPVTSAGGVVEVEMKDISFSPDEVTIKVGEKVKWTNRDSVSHSIRDDGGLFESGLIKEGGVFEFTYGEAGTFPYTCTVHPTTMKGTVIVEE